MTAISRIRLAWILLVVTLSSLATLAVAVPLALAQDSLNEVEVVGVIEAVEGTTLTVNGLRIETAGAQIKTALTVDAAVKVEGVLQPDGTILAREVKAAEDDGLLPGEIEIVGTLQILTSTAATVNGLVFDLATAEVQAGLAIGDVVKVHARLGDGGVWLAREIERFVPDDSSAAMPDGHPVLPPGTECTQCHEQTPTIPGPIVEMDDHELKIVGVLEEIGEGYVVVGGQRFDTTGAEIKGQLIVGALVKLALIRLDSGILIVREVKPTTFSDDSTDDMDSSHDDSVDDSRDDGDDDSVRDGDSDDSVGDSAACAFEIKVTSANLRSGPGTSYDVIGYAFHDQKFAVLEIDATRTWIKVALPDGQQGWLAISVGELDDDYCGGLPVGDEVFKDDDHSSDDDHGGKSGDDDHGG
ncbi:MAG: DUF5666 domain-containing protein, partial [Aggregatilineaceae bacterium]